MERSLGGETLKHKCSQHDVLWDCHCLVPPLWTCSFCSSGSEKYVFWGPVPAAAAASSSTQQRRVRARADNRQGPLTWSCYLLLWRVRRAHHLQSDAAAEQPVGRSRCAVHEKTYGSPDGGLITVGMQTLPLPRRVGP